MADIIFTPTVQHTGTWFLIDLFRAHPQVSNAVSYLFDLRNRNKTMIEGKLNILHVHVPSSSDREDEDLVTSADYMNRYGFVAPLRDPLKSLITRQTRRPDLTHTYMVDGFVFLAENSGLKCEFLPIDSNSHHPTMLRYARKQITAKVLAQYGLEHTKETLNYINMWAPPSYNVSANNKLKAAYVQGDAEYIRSVIPVEYQYLQDHAHIIKPFLQDNHYNIEGLIW